MRIGAKAPREIASIGVFDLDNLRAQAREMVAAERACQHVRQVEDTDTGERQGHLTKPSLRYLRPLRLKFLLRSMLAVAILESKSLNTASGTLAASASIRPLWENSAFDAFRKSTFTSRLSVLYRVGTTSCSVDTELIQEP
ncbi:hypothetical protein [Bradyrhizobium sp. sBnM-33]|uniref:hypothetical protein n=1 Tax=Bradyrhizobium sp. sBnM-33 TaxID=2831780 RepID=UPI00293F4B11|nr:hypothetical protein [Bradyrhizobium sp. sBnM-33]WOH54852.1 hypothetical protein RX328_07790 [Bradyrhizobium sp. sBnM-33]